jgi:imidazole glycerol-phosphate synthase subunit HisF
MLKKRLVGVVTIKNGWAVQSFGYQRYLPLGKPLCVIENLDRWGVDEILVQVIDRSTGDQGPDFDLLERIGKHGLETPLIYGGGIRTEADGVRLVQMGADRLLIDTLLHRNLPAVDALSKRLGAQALIASLPMSWGDGQLAWHDYRANCDKPVTGELEQFLQSGALSETLLVDWKGEGQVGGFTNALVEKFPVKNMPLIAFGGLSDVSQMKELMQKSNVVAVAVGNFLNYREHAVQEYKSALKGLPVRLPTFATENTLMAEADA